MKLNKIFMALAATAMVGCSSEDVMDFTANQAAEDSNLIQLAPDFALAGVGEDGDVTRTHWAKSGKSLVNMFLPIYTEAPDGTKTLDKLVVPEAEAVGLCWLGQTTGTNVYTNYQFYHFGWLNIAETDVKTKCGNFTNGVMYDEVTPSDGVVGEEADVTKFAFPTTPIDKTGFTLNYNSGVYKTDNKAIFGGKYIAYYPFNDEFKEVGTIPAKAVTEFDPISESYETPELANATFRYSAPFEIKGGDQAAGFGLYNLSALVRLNVAAPKGYTGKTKYDQVVLYSKKKELLKQANLGADLIAAGKKGTALYKETDGTNVIVAKFASAVELKATDEAHISGYITALPTTVSDLEVLVHSESGKWARVNVGSTTFEDGAGKNLEISVKDDDFKANYIAIDDASLMEALGEARANFSSNPTIEVIGDITLKTVNNIADVKDANITIKGDAIIVPEDFTLTLNTNMESDIIIKGKSCCTGTTGGRLVVEGGKISNVTMEKADEEAIGEYAVINPMVTFQTNAATVDAGKTFEAKAGTIKVDAAVSHKANMNIAEDVNLTVSSTGGLNFMGGTVVNNGTIEVKKAGKFDMTDEDGNATATDGQRMTNNGKFIHNVDAAVGTAVQSMNQNGEYRCRVDQQIKLDDAYQQWTACSVIEMVNTDAQTYDLGVAEPNIDYKHNSKYIDIEVNTAAGIETHFSNPDLGSGNGDSKDIQIGNLTVKKGILRIYYVTGEGKRTLTVNGDMKVSDGVSINNSREINITGNLTIDGTGLWYAGNKANEGGLAVTKDITVTGKGVQFNADFVDALDITCANFYLKSGAKALFGNRTNGATQTLTVSGTIDNPAGCEFNIHAANQNGAGSVLARITCKKLTVGGDFPGGRPQVVK